jgi:hypothetical protein
VKWNPKSARTVNVTIVPAPKASAMLAQNASAELTAHAPIAVTTVLALALDVVIAKAALPLAATALTANADQPASVPPARLFSATGASKVWLSHSDIFWN